MTDDLVGAGIGLPLIVAAARPVPSAIGGPPIALADVGTGGKALTMGDLFEKQQGLDRAAGVGEGFGRIRGRVTEAFGGGVHGAPEAGIIVGGGPSELPAPARGW